MKINEVSWKDRKAKRPSCAVTDAEVQAAMPKTRLQLTNQLRNDGVLRPRVDLRSTTSRSKPPTQIGSNLRSSSASSIYLPSSMSDKSLVRLAADPVRSLKYGSQLKGFSETMNKRIESRQMSSRFVENDSLNKLERRLNNIGSSAVDEFEDYFDDDELRAIKVSQTDCVCSKTKRRFGSSLYRLVLARPNRPLILIPLHLTFECGFERPIEPHSCMKSILRH